MINEINLDDIEAAYSSANGKSTSDFADIVYGGGEEIEALEQYLRSIDRLEQCSAQELGYLRNIDRLEHDKENKQRNIR